MRKLKKSLDNKNIFDICDEILEGQYGLAQKDLRKYEKKNGEGFASRFLTSCNTALTGTKGNSMQVLYEASKYVEDADFGELKKCLEVPMEEELPFHFSLVADEILDRYKEELSEDDIMDIYEVGMYYAAELKEKKMFDTYYYTYVEEFGEDELPEECVLQKKINDGKYQEVLDEVAKLEEDEVGEFFDIVANAKYMLGDSEGAINLLKEIVDDNYAYFMVSKFEDKKTEESANKAYDLLKKSIELGAGKDMVEEVNELIKCCLLTGRYEEVIELTDKFNLPEEMKVNYLKKAYLYLGKLEEVASIMSDPINIANQKFSFYEAYTILHMVESKSLIEVLEDTGVIRVIPYLEHIFAGRFDLALNAISFMLDEVEEGDETTVLEFDKDYVLACMGKEVKLTFNKYDIHRLEIEGKKVSPFTYEELEKML